MNERVMISVMASEITDIWTRLAKVEIDLANLKERLNNGNNVRGNIHDAGANAGTISMRNNNSASGVECTLKEASGTAEVHIGERKLMKTHKRGKCRVYKEGVNCSYITKLKKELELTTEEAIARWQKGKRLRDLRKQALKERGISSPAISARLSHGWTLAEAIVLPKLPMAGDTRHVKAKYLQEHPDVLKEIERVDKLIKEA